MERIMFWKVQNEKLVDVKKCKLDFETRLEQWLAEDLTILAPGLCFLGNQVCIYNNRIDILAIDNDDSFVVIEIKKDKTTRESISQALDYASIIEQIPQNKLISAITNGEEDEQDLINFLNHKYPSKNWDDFNLTDAKQNPRVIVVGTEIDDPTIRIITYLQGRDINIEAIAFNYFKTSDGFEFLAKSSYSPDVGEQIKTRKERLVLNLFKNKKINIGDEFYYWPATSQGIPKGDERICATIVKEGTKCLQRKDDEMIYSFSRLRKIIIEELGIDGIKPNWGFGIKSEWRLSSNDKSLEELTD